MKRTILAAVLLVAITASSSYAGGCERFAFGSQEWWQCTTHEKSGPS
ncbi:MAG: hypothetical protein JXQ99_20640 [Hyphomicrobiaceae bacterium]